MEIKTADQILKKHIGETMSQFGVFNAMKEYAKQFIDLAAEEVELGVLSNSKKKESKESILKIKQLIK